MPLKEDQKAISMLTVRCLWIFNMYFVILGHCDLSANKKTAQYNTIIECPSCEARNAVDRNLSTCTRTDMGRTSLEKYTWWYVDLGDVQSVYNIRIQFRDYGQMYTMRQRGRFAGFSLYVSNSTDRQSKDLCYKDGPELPPLDFNTNCTNYGRYVIFYNERKVGMDYPIGYINENVIIELCEVTVTGCPYGYYGVDCETKCAGYCKDNKACNHINGLCENGCYDGWTGENCTQECPASTFGPDCLYNCSRNCLGDVYCDRTTGRCDTGCKPGYTGELCDTGCEYGTFGRDCSNICSRNCLHNVSCNSISGHCDSGCASGYFDVFCNKICDQGTYGLGCMQNCSVHCPDGLCNNVDGSCNSLNERSQSHVSNNNCNESFYVVGLSILVIVTILLSSACLLIMWKYKRLVKIVRSQQYASITSMQLENIAKDGQQYEELRVS